MNINDFVIDFDLPKGPKTRLKAWNERFPVGTEVAVDFGSMHFISKTRGLAYIRNRKVYIPIYNIEGDPSIEKVVPMMDGADNFLNQKRRSHD